MSQQRQEKIEIDKRAALLVYKMRAGQISRRDVVQEIERTDESKRELLKSALNKYRGLI